METAAIFDVKHFAIHDGPGIRTTFFPDGLSATLSVVSESGIAKK